MITSTNIQRRGFTLTEIAIVLGIMGLILGAIWVAAAGVYNNQRVNSANTAVMQIAQGVRGLYATSASTGVTGNMTSDLITASAVPNNLIATGVTTNLVGPFPGGKTVISSTSDSNGFMIVMSGVSKSACISLLTAVGGSSRDPGLFNADAVDGTTEPTAATMAGYVGVTGTALTTTITPAAAAGATQGTALTSGYGGCQADKNVVRVGFTLK